MVVGRLFLVGDSGSPGPTPTTNVLPTTSVEPTTTLADEGTPASPTCPETDGSSPHQLQFTGPPPQCIDHDATYVATVETTRGNFEITLDPKTAPEGVNSFVFLARWHYYDGVGFSRVLSDYVMQVGDPVHGDLADSGNAGYLLPEEPPRQQPFYPEGSVVLANQPPKPNTTGSEFFVITGSGPQVDQLTPSFTRIGRVTSGQSVVDAINATGRLSDEVGGPTSVTVIQRIVVASRGGSAARSGWRG
jgi:cyclophilin family peptidyl-prolyl cis-trans isomerase